jgi:hypothetical protein
MSDRYSRVRRAYILFVEQQGEYVTFNDIINATGWSEASVRTYYNKKWAGYILEQVEPLVFEVCMPSGMSESEFVNHHSQIDDEIKF